MLPFLCEYNGRRKKCIVTGERLGYSAVSRYCWNISDLVGGVGFQFGALVVFASYMTPEPVTKILEQSVYNRLCLFSLVFQPFLFLNPQDSSSVIQFVTRAKVRVDTTNWAVEVPNGNSEVATVRLKLVSALFVSLIWNALEDLALS